MPRTCILVIGNEPGGQASLTGCLAAEGYEVLNAPAGETAWEMITASHQDIDVILLDRELSDMDGIEILRRAKSHRQLLHTPVILQTAAAADGEIAEGLRAGAYYCLTRPFSADTLLAIVSAAAADHREYRRLRQEARQPGQGLACLKSACFAFRTPEEARNIAALVAHAAPDPDRVVLGLCELMVNAIEHGNLGIGYREKSRLIEEGGLSEEIARRLALPECSGKQAELRVDRADGQVSFAIRDQGTGFDWRNYLEMSPERACDTHGRGIAMSRHLCFDAVEYRGCGNEVVAFVRL